MTPGPDLQKDSSDIKKLEIRTRCIVEIIKILTTGIVVTLIPVLINQEIQNQIIENERLRVEKDYLTIFGDRFENLEKRISNGEIITDKEEILLSKRDYVEYLSIVAASKNSRERWEIYLNSLNEKLGQIQIKDKKIIENDQQADQKRREISDLKVLKNLNDEEKKKLEELKQELNQLEKETEALQEKRSEIINREVRQVLPSIPKPSTEVIDSLISNFSGPKRRESSNQLIELYNKNQDRSEIIEGLFQAIEENKDNYRVSLYVLRTLSKLEEGWACTEKQKELLNSLKKTNYSQDTTFQARHQDAVNKGKGCNPKN